MHIEKIVCPLAFALVLFIAVQPSYGQTTAAGGQGDAGGQNATGDDAGGAGGATMAPGDFGKLGSLVVALEATCSQCKDAAMLGTKEDCGPAKKVAECAEKDEACKSDPNLKPLQDEIDAVCNTNSAVNEKSVPLIIAGTLFIVASAIF